MFSKLEAGYRAGQRKSQFFLKRSKGLGHEIDENGINPNEVKVEAIQKLKSSNNTKELKSFLGNTIQYTIDTIPSKSSTETIGKDGQIEKNVEKGQTMDLGRKTGKRFQTNKTDADR